VVAEAAGSALRKEAEEAIKAQEKTHEIARAGVRSGLEKWKSEIGKSACG
jgi:hypothetical protein